MKVFISVLFCSGTLFTGCGVTRDVAVTSYHVATAPVTIVRRQFEDSPPTNTTTRSDVDVPGHPVATSTPTPPRRRVTSASSNTPGANTSKRDRPNQTNAKSLTTQVQFPVAKPVPGKPGYVYSPFDSTKYVDVSGYASGSKVKDPYAQKIFVVP